MFTTIPIKYVLIISIVVILAITIIIIVRRSNEDRKAQRELDRYLKQNLLPEEIGRFYERYVGHLYETEGFEVEYNGAISGFDDLGRDLIVKCVDEVLIVQTKCWARKKAIHEKHVFQLFGTMTHFKRTQKTKIPTRAIIYTTAKYSEKTQEVAEVLGVELRILELNRSYPMIKCNTSSCGEKFYYLPFDMNYDKIKMDLHRDDLFALTVKEAVDKGFRRAA